LVSRQHENDEGKPVSDSLQFIRDLFKKADVPLLQSDVWAVQGTPVVKHKALERLAAASKIKFDKPQILRAEKDEAVILVTGCVGDAQEWSIGEACVNVNYRVSGKMAAYVYAMAEKRAKDRVILKLAGLHGVYSEDEADDFRAQSDPRDEFSDRPAAKAAKAQLKELSNHIDRTGRSIDRLLKHYGVEAIEGLTATDAAAAIEMLCGIADKPKAA
jgi:hypothetical protein